VPTHRRRKFSFASQDKSSWIDHYWRTFQLNMFGNTVSYYWSEKLLVTLIYFQLFGMLLSTFTTLPYFFRLGFSATMLLNFDFYSFLLVVSLYWSPLKVIVSPYWLLVCSIVPMALLCLLVVITSIVSVFGPKLFPGQSSPIRAKCRRILYVCYYLLYVPLAVQVSKLLYCASPLFGCWSTLQLILVCAIVPVSIAVLVIPLVYMVKLIHSRVVFARSFDHEEYLQLKETEYIVELDLLWKTQDFHLFSNYKRKGAYWTPLSLGWIGALAGGLSLFLPGSYYFEEALSTIDALINGYASLYSQYIFSLSSASICAGWAFLLASLALVMICVTMPFRCGSSNIVLMAAGWSLFGDLFLIFLVSFGASSFLFVDTVLSFLLSLITLGPLILAWGVTILVTACLGSRWPVTPQSVSRLTEDQQAYVEAVSESRILLREQQFRTREFVQCDVIESTIILLERLKNQAVLADHPLAYTLSDVLMQAVSMYNAARPYTILPYPPLEEHIVDFRHKLDERAEDFLLIPPNRRIILLFLVAVRALLNGRSFHARQIVRSNTGFALGVVSELEALNMQLGDDAGSEEEEHEGEEEDDAFNREMQDINDADEDDAAADFYSPIGKSLTRKASAKLLDWNPVEPAKAKEQEKKQKRQSLWQTKVWKHFPSIAGKERNSLGAASSFADAVLEARRRQKREALEQAKAEAEKARKSRSEQANAGSKPRNQWQKSVAKIRAARKPISTLQKRQQLFDLEEKKHRLGALTPASLEEFSQEDDDTITALLAEASEAAPSPLSSSIPSDGGQLPQKGMTMRSPQQMTPKSEYGEIPALLPSDGTEDTVTSPLGTPTVYVAPVEWKDSMPKETHILIERHAQLFQDLSAEKIKQRDPSANALLELENDVLTMALQPAKVAALSSSDSEILQMDAVVLGEWKSSLKHLLKSFEQGFKKVFGRMPTAGEKKRNISVHCLFNRYNMIAGEISRREKAAVQAEVVDQSFTSTKPPPSSSSQEGQDAAVQAVAAIVEEIGDPDLAQVSPQELPRWKSRLKDVLAQWEENFEQQRGRKPSNADKKQTLVVLEGFRLYKSISTHLKDHPVRESQSQEAAQSSQSQLVEPAAAQANTPPEEEQPKLKARLKAYEAEFLKQYGRKITDADKKKDPAILEAYRRYKTLQKQRAKASEPVN
jgi:hypothetical protein